MFLYKLYIHISAMHSIFWFVQFHVHRN